MDTFERLPRGPVISSLTSAKQVFAEWLKENDYSTLSDFDGMTWRLEVSHEPKPNPGDPLRPFWQVRLILKCETRAEELVRTGVLDRQVDQRLIGLIHDRQIPLAARPQHFTATSMEDARRFVIAKIPEIKQQLLTETQNAAKRRLVERWLDESCCFSQKTF